MGRLAWARDRGAHGRPRYGQLGHDRAYDTIERPHDTAGLRSRQAARVRAWPLGMKVVIQSCIVAGGQPCGSRYSTRLGRWVVSRDRHDTTPSACEAGAWVAIQFCIVIGGKGNARMRAATRQGTLGTQSRRGPRHGPVRTMTLRSARSLGSGCAPGAPSPILIQCTVFSHCLGHCS